MYTLNLKCRILLLQERNPNRKCISEIPVSNNEEDQSLPVEVQVKEHTLKTDNNDDQR
jgi:hypothetical protein